MNVQPQNMEMEEAILGSMLISEYARDAALDTGLAAEHFYRDSHAILFSAIRAVSERGPVDVLTVADHLRSTKVRGDNGKDVEALKHIGGSLTILSLQERVPAVRNAKAYAAEVVKQARLRWLVRVGEQITALGMNPSNESADDLINRAGELVSGAQRQAAADFVALDDLLTPLYDQWVDRHNSGGMLTGLETGFPHLDDLLGGLQAGTLNVLAARPGMGKSALATSIVQNAAVKGGKHVAMFSLEMSADDVATRVISGLGRVNSKRLKTGKPLAHDFGQISKAMEQIRKDAPGRVLIDQSPGVSPFQIRSRCRRLASQLQRRGESLGLVIVDYLQLMESGKRSENRNLDVAKISRELKLMALELRIPVLALSQLSRSVESRTDKKPMLSDLRDSGAIEQDADTVLFIYRADYYHTGPTPIEPALKDTAEIIVAKNRHGEQGTAWLGWLPEYTTFVNLNKRTAA